MRMIRMGRPADLAAECRNAGVDAVATRSLIAGARNIASGIIDAPGLAKLGEALLADVADDDRSGERRRCEQR